MAAVSLFVLVVLVQGAVGRIDRIVCIQVWGWGDIFAFAVINWVVMSCCCWLEGRHGSRGAHRVFNRFYLFISTRHADGSPLYLSSLYVFPSHM